MIRVGFIPGRSTTGSIHLAADAILSCKSLLMERGITLRLDCDADADVLWIYWAHLAKERKPLLSSGVPIIVDEERDSAQVTPALREEANNNDSIIGIVKPFLYRDNGLYSRKQWDVGYHHELLQKCRPEIYPAHPKPVGPDFDTTLLHLSASYGTFRRLDPIKERDINTEMPRPCHVHFRGWVQYGNGSDNGSYPTAHRTMCVDAAHKLTGYRTIISAARDISSPAYWNELEGSMICLSPWGWAPPCHRDYEAILCGCLMVKPPSKHIIGFPDIYDPMPWYSPCKPDFSDLQSVVDSELAVWNDNAALRSRLRARLIEESSKEALADHIAAVIHKCMERIPA